MLTLSQRLSHAPTHTYTRAHSLTHIYLRQSGFFSPQEGDGVVQNFVHFSLGWSGSGSASGWDGSSCVDGSQAAFLFFFFAGASAPTRMLMVWETGKGKRATRADCRAAAPAVVVALFACYRRAKVFGAGTKIPPFHIYPSPFFHVLFSQTSPANLLSRTYHPALQKVSGFASFCFVRRPCLLAVALRRVFSACLCSPLCRSRAHASPRARTRAVYVLCISAVASTSCSLILPCL